MKVFNVIMVNGQEADVTSFYVNSRVIDPEAALRAAVQDFLDSGTEEATRVHKHTRFTWCDAMAWVPGRYFIDRGLTPLMGNESVDVVLDRDEPMIQS